MFSTIKIKAVNKWVAVSVQKLSINFVQVGIGKNKKAFVQQNKPRD